MKPLVSIITPVYQAEAFLTQTIESVLAQTYGNWELLLVIDQKSTDRSAEIARTYASRDLRIRALTDTSCLGVAANRNFGLGKASGEYVAFLDADDLWRPEKLATQSEYMETRGIDFSFHDYDCIDALGADMRRTVTANLQEIRYGDMLTHNYIGCLTVMISKSALGNLRFYPGHHEDYCLWLDYLRSGKVAKHLTENLAHYRILAGSRSGNKFVAAQARWEILRGREKLGFFASMVCLARYTLAGILKRI